MRVSSGESLRVTRDACEGPVKTNSAAAMSAIRRRRCFTSDRWINSTIAGGRSSGSAPHSGSLRKTAASVSLTSSPSKARLAVSIS
jgi:hypothetical protein